MGPLTQLNGMSLLSSGSEILQTLGSTDKQLVAIFMVVSNNLEIAIYVLKSANGGLFYTLQKIQFYRNDLHLSFYNKRWNFSFLNFFSVGLQIIKILNNLCKLNIKPRIEILHQTLIISSKMRFLILMGEGRQKRGLDMNLN